MFFRLFKTDIKRILKLIPALIIFTIIPAAVFSIGIFNADKLIYKNSEYAAIDVGVVMPAHSTYSEMAYNLVSGMDSYSNNCNILEVDSEAAGKEMLSEGLIAALIIIPDGIVSDIWNGTNTPIKVIYRENGTFKSCILSAIFTSTASMLATSEAAIYSAVDIAKANKLSDHICDKINQETNNIFIDYILTRTDIYEQRQVYATGTYSTLEHYMGAAIILLLSLCGTIFISFMKNDSTAFQLMLKSHGIKKGLRAVSFLLSIFIYMYGIYIFLLLLLLGANAVYPKKPFNIHLSGLLYGIPVVLFIVIFIVVIGYLTKSLSSGCLMLLFLTLILAYAGGLLIPEAMLPAFIKNLCHYTPYYKLNQMICYGLYH